MIRWQRPRAPQAIRIRLGQPFRARRCMFCAAGHTWRNVVVRHIGAIRLVGLLLVLAALVSWRTPHSIIQTHLPTAVLVGYARVIDGDTLDLSGTRIRLHGIDAPEIRQPCTTSGRIYQCGLLAAQALADLVRGRRMRCDTMGLDPYGRTIARCTTEGDGKDIESWMVRQGYAVAYTRYSYAYLTDELIARGERRGIWAGTFEWPWDYRHEAR